MSRLQTLPVDARPESLIRSHRVLRNTYALLAMTLLFSGTMATISLLADLPHPGVLLTLVGYFGLFFLVHRYQNSALGLVWLFGLTGFMGLTLGPILNVYLTHFAQGPQLVALALAGTGFTFLGLSAYALISRRDFGFLGGLLGTGILVAFLASLAVLFIPGIQGMAVGVSALFVILMAGMILFETSRIIHGGETNYILATLSLYVTIYNLFVSLLQIFGVLQNDD